MHELFENIGVILVIAGVLGRLWSTLYIGQRKNRHLIVTGPYSITRNPLYVSSMLAILGVSLMIGSALITAIFVPIFFFLFAYAARRESEYLRSKFGSVYDDYAARTPFFVPNPLLMKLGAEVTFRTSSLTTAFRDALFLIALIPLSELLEFLHEGRYLYAVFYIP
ncbi:methyltransferase family protein [Rhizobium sp. Root1203]|uniref:methyltransferase family protein n=1 Tax=Rhizobium sp. Root1203 TaxID=1736427 RepID=UPI00138F2D80|nr:isoprenylcysteine carboxylmethyltransferase family protein [Rhizobium sp. Root1203]